MMKMTTEAAPSMDAPITGKHRQTFLRMWHAWALGAFAIAYLTAEDASYAMHRFAGYAVLCCRSDCQERTLLPCRAKFDTMLPNVTRGLSLLASGQ